MEQSTNFRRFCERHSRIAETILRAGKEFTKVNSEKEAKFSIQISRIHRLAGEYDSAKLALQPFKSSPQPWVTAAKLDNLGRICHDTFNFRAAHHAYLEAFSYIKQIEDIEQSKGREASLEHNISYLELTRTDRERDLDLVQQGLFGALRNYNQLNDDEGYAYVCLHLAQLEREQGNLKGADEFTAEATNIEEKIRNWPGLALAYQQSAKNALVQGELGLGIHLLGSAKSVIELVPACKRIKADILMDFARIGLNEEATLGEGADAFAKEARILYEEMDLPPEFFDTTFAKF